MTDKKAAKVVSEGVDLSQVHIDTGDRKLPQGPGIIRRPIEPEEFASKCVFLLNLLVCGNYKCGVPVWCVVLTIIITISVTVTNCSAENSTCVPDNDFPMDRRVLLESVHGLWDSLESMYKDLSAEEYFPKL